ncbi:MAG: class I SAM-dependent methyltransferase, partial [Holophagales bacterium]|nr:class I SAM-dependent methyltransferase [Holophagales bacterium]
MARAPIEGRQAGTRIDYDPVAELYDLYVTADYDVPFFLDAIKGVEGPVLELTSGTGRLSIPLLEAGGRLTCVDASAGMLAVLERKLQERGLEAETVLADVCELRLPTRFELVIFPFQSFLELVGEERQRACLEAVHACLAPGGRFVCTLHNPAVRRTQVDGTCRLVGRFPASEGNLVVSGFERGGRPVVERLQIFELYGPDGVLRWKRLMPREFELVEKERFEQMAEA